MTDEGSGGQPMPFAIDMLAGVEVLITLMACAILFFAMLTRGEAHTTLPHMAPIYPRVFYEAGPTVLALLAGPPLVIAVGLVLRKAWARYASILLHVSLGACAVWHFSAQIFDKHASVANSADITIGMCFLLAQAVGVPLFLNRRHVRAAFVRGRR